MLGPRYDHASVEPDIYKAWEASGYFNPDNLPLSADAKPYTIIMPPPNANGSLHTGHALMLAIQDILIRYKRMRGFRALWLPGADHAGFETQIVYEKELEKQGRSRFTTPPDQLYKEILEFTLRNKSTMENQVRSLGASCDWSREKFTLDPDIIQRTQEVFKKMYDDGLVYRGKRPVNWCTKHQTSLSDVETESKEQTDMLYYIQYGPFVVATVRPETIFGDTAVAVHPDDERYKQYVGTTITVEMPTGPRELPVIDDPMVDREFGTGALKITPAHDKNDFDVAARHSLPAIEATDQYGKLTEVAGKYRGMKVTEAREAVVADLTQMGLLIKTEEYPHIVPTCFKCGTTIEPRIMDQWFVKMQPLAEHALAAVREKQLAFIPERFEKVFTYWMDHTIDWNISRQIVWGIPIPAKICEGCGEGVPDLEDTVTVCPKCSGNVRRDTDTFDTWFSSGQWPYFTLGWPDGKDFSVFYPTDVMETGYDLVFKWVPRMVFFGLYMTGKSPFHTVYFHGLVNDAKGKKMSKSKGNVSNPLELTAKYGTDALRMALVVGNAPGNDMALSEDKIRGYRNFSTKIWNAARFVLSNNSGADAAELTEADKKILADATAAKETVGAYLDKLEFHLAAEYAYHYFWHTFADRVLEEAKPRLRAEDAQDKAAAGRMLREVLVLCLTMLHPFMPFVTEAIYRELDPDGLLMVKAW